MTPETQNAIDARRSRLEVSGHELDEVVTHLRLLGGDVHAMNVKKVSRYELEVSYKTAADELPLGNSPAVQHETCDNNEPIQ